MRAGKKLRIVLLFFIIILVAKSLLQLSSFQKDHFSSKGLQEIVKLPAYFSNNKNENVANVNATRIIRQRTNGVGYDGVVIVTKVLWPKDLVMLQQWSCLINHAYNDKYQYDIIVFTTQPWSEDDIQTLQNSTHPIRTSVVLEGPPTLEGHLADMTPAELQFLRSRCKFEHPENETLTWMHYCTNGRLTNNLAYAWQAEFRTYHIWTHPALDAYKYMIWLDADALVGTSWHDTKDPMQVMVENDLTVLYAGWPYGHSGDGMIQNKIHHAYGDWICNIKETRQNNATFLYTEDCETPKWFRIGQLAGNHHITNLDVFRKPIHQAFLKNFSIGEYRFARQYDDQLAVTIVGVMEQYIENKKRNVTVKNATFQPTIWHERSNGMTLKIAHHGMYDVQRREKTRRDRKNFFKEIKQNWTGVEGKCLKSFLLKLRKPENKTKKIEPKKTESMPSNRDKTKDLGELIRATKIAYEEDKRRKENLKGF